MIKSYELLLSSDLLSAVFLWFMYRLPFIDVVLLGIVVLKLWVLLISKEKESRFTNWLLFFLTVSVKARLGTLVSF